MGIVVPTNVNNKHMFSSFDPDGRRHSCGYQVYNRNIEEITLEMIDFSMKLSETVLYLKYIYYILINFRICIQTILNIIRVPTLNKKNLLYCKI
jgi:hypothetical protein